MHDIGLSVLVLGGFAVGTTLTGRAVATLCRIRLLQRWTPENLFASAFLGTAVWILTFGYCCYLGLHALPAALVVLGLAAALLAARATLRPWSRPAPKRLWLALGVVLTPVVLAVVAALLPVLRGDCYNFHSDSIFYINLADWLQGHGLWNVGPYDPAHPMWQSVGIIETTGHRVGPIFLLALARALLPGAEVVHLFPAVTAWGVALNVAAVYVLCRWSFRCGMSSALLAALLAGGVNPLSYSANFGFLCQLYGTAVLAFGLAVLGRLGPRARWDLGGAVLLALTAALQLSVYSELAPFFAAGAFVYLAAGAPRAWRKGSFARYLAFTGGTVGLFVLAANIELARATKAILFMAGVNGVGWHFDWSILEYWSFAMGARPYPAYIKPLMAGLILAASVVLSAVFLIGLVRAARRRWSWPAVAALLMLGALAAYYHWAARDPWSGAIGHTWNQFKLCKWSFVLIVAVQGAGLDRVLRFVPRFRQALLAAACLLVISASGLGHWHETDKLVREQQEAMQSKAPLASIRELRRRVDELNPSALYYIPNVKWPAYYTNVITSVLSNRPFVNGWKDRQQSYYDPSFTADRIVWPPPDDVLGLMAGAPPFGPSLCPLTCGVTAVDLRRPFVVRIGRPDCVTQGADGRLDVRIGPEAADLDVWSPEAGAVTLTVTVAPPRSADAARLRAVFEGGVASEVAVVGDTISLPLVLQAGLNRLSLRFLSDEKAPPSFLTVVHMSLAMDGKQP